MEQDTIKASVDKASNIDIKDLISMGITKWWWFLISLTITLGVATFYMLRTSPVFTRTTTILIKDDEDSRDPLSKAGFSQFSILKADKMIQNELLTLKSISLMQEVVERLSLNDCYFTHKGLRKTDMYKANPVNVRLLDSLSINNSVSFDFEVGGDGTVTMSDFRRDRDKFSETVEGKIGQTVKTPVGMVMLSRTPWYNAEMLNEEYTYEHKTALNAAKNFSTAIKPELGNEDSYVINISYSGENIQKSDDMLRTLIDVYNEQWIKDKNQVAVSTYEFINSRLQVLEQELGEVDADISSYKSANLLPDLEESSRLYITQSAENQTQLTAISNQLYMASYLRQEVAKNDVTKPLPANSGIENQALEGLITEYNGMVIERSRLLSNSSESNPIVIDLTNSLRTLHTNILVSLDNVITSLKRQQQSLQALESQATARLAQSPNQAKYLLSVGREQKVKESLYLYLLEKREENQLSQAFTAYNTRLIDAPFGDDEPTSPKAIVIYFLALVIGVVVPFGVLFVRESLNTKVRGKRDLEGINIPLMAEIPQIKDTDHVDQISLKKKHRVNAGVKDIVVKEGKRDVINEAFRVLRTNLEFVTTKSQGCNVVMVTSFNPGSGKSLISMNLAITLGLRGKRVLVIDGDLRRASTSAYVNNPKKGISNYLAGGIADYHQVIVPLEANRNVDVIPVGKIPPNPSELLGEPRMTELIEMLKPEYDYILIDCPPVDIVADTAVVASLASRTIFVVRAGLLERSMLGELEEIYKEGRFNNMSIILNCVPVSSGRYGYKYGYKYGHYGYGYGSGYGSYGGHDSNDSDEE